MRVWEASLTASEISYYKMLFPFACNLDKVQKLTLKHFKLVVSLNSLGVILLQEDQLFFLIEATEKCCSALYNSAFKNSS